MTFRLRWLETDPYGRAGQTAPVDCATREQAEEICRACPNAEHLEVFES